MSRKAAAESLCRRHERSAALAAARQVATAVEVLSNSGKQSYSRYQRCCFGVSLSSLQGATVEDYFSQPVVISGLFFPGVYLLTHPLAHSGAWDELC
ncbi:unnamed protein product [Rangifer tarandus platyrhynchus]|uniref:Uncharacterized protein n=1 Tax=Rangifer tarandus platyrhynchus TaxID=3082113 RepID=A0AC59YLL6_RANTA